MTGLLRKAMLLACAGVLAAPMAQAAVPSAADSDVPCQINIVGKTGVNPDVAGIVTIIIRDAGHNAIPGSSVVVDFDACFGAVAGDDIRVCASQATAGVTADCSTAIGEVSGVTDGSGNLTLGILGGAKNTGTHAAGAGYRCASVYADGILMKVVNIGAYDENGAGGNNPADFSVWLTDSFDFPGTYHSRSDYNSLCTDTAPGTGVNQTKINPADGSLLLAVNFHGDTSCAAYCH